MDKDILFAFIYILVCFVGWIIAYAYGKNTKRFHWSEYALLVIWPALGTMGLAYVYGMRIVSLFVISCVFGFALEYGAGLTYHKVLGKRLWTYDMFSVQGYTSLLTIPVWGMVGVIFWFLGKIVGL